MDKWLGAAAVCINEQNELLMVLQGKPEEKKTWTVPSGGVLEEESLEQCCMRETFEETGYLIRVVERLRTKTGRIGKTDIHVEYFSCMVKGGSMQIQDPDHLIHEVRWVSKEELNELELSFSEDQLFLNHMLTKKNEGVDRA
ncbi:NUDIX hydrolase [Halobacillus aidingensis]|uniref:Aminoglycoside 6'-N-acetyltransferase n=1 Tax=Halobacillus aidingensis TaxID=240303 RepID=A0A1H0K604_HALAD|nr:NUDIX hydrolase [Halobacillus aidingensis]SDO51326.1 aminoglycoside 6'-N-acetyltransferase [Halobacillus aidingensis]